MTMNLTVSEYAQLKRIMRNTRRSSHNEKRLNDELLGNNEVPVEREFQDYDYGQNNRYGVKR